MLSLWFLSPALAVPDVDAPVRSGARAGGDAAVVIGIEDYFKLPKVPHAERDARAFHDLLLYTRGVPPQQLRLLDDGASRETILEAAGEAASRAGPGGTVWVYFAGHGAASPSTGERMILGDDVRADLASFEARAVTVSELEKAASSRGHDVITVLDTCFTGHDRSGAELLTGKRFAVPSYAVSGGSAVQWVAASPNQFSGPLDDALHGAFTYAVLGALRGWADGWISGQPDGRVTADEASVYVAEALRLLRIEDQDPVILGGGLEDLVLTEGALEGPPRIGATPPAPPSGPDPIVTPPAVAPTTRPPGRSTATESCRETEPGTWVCGAHPPVTVTDGVACGEPFERLVAPISMRDLKAKHGKQGAQMLRSGSERTELGGKQVQVFWQRFEWTADADLGWADQRWQTAGTVDVCLDGRRLHCRHDIGRLLNYGHATEPWQTCRAAIEELTVYLAARGGVMPP